MIGDGDDGPGATTGGNLAAFIPSLLRRWWREAPDRAHLRVDGTLLFVDVSGFTALTERLAAAGRSGSEDIANVIGSV